MTRYRVRRIALFGVDATERDQLVCRVGLARLILMRWSCHLVAPACSR
jgi:hypothetical protein